MFAVEIVLRVSHDRGKVTIEVVTEYSFYLRKACCMLDFDHILIIQLVQQLFLGLFYGVVVYLHLLGEELFQPFILFYPVLNETDGGHPVDFYGMFAFLPVIEPCFRPPSDSGAVGIDGHHSRNIEALYVYLQFRQRVDNAAAGYCLGLKFFFTSSLMVER